MLAAICVALSIIIVPLIWPDLDPKNYISVSNILSFFPILPWLFDLGLSRLNSAQAKSGEVMKAYDDLPHLQRGWLLSGFCAMVAHVAYLVSYVLAGNRLVDINTARAVLSGFHIFKHSSMDAEFLVFTISTLIWVLSAAVANNDATRSLTTKLIFSAVTVASGVVIGPGAVISILWVLSEDGRRSTA
ncbi:hypothetical protein Z517_06825 [Fonsecaea pedrosoi CBS 271.37]|uniref:Uncharacterized protein n=1 Tax=Fonsecaea pedrosoi CBS 271.37 TaxID=1442368 RepID=A0A0D2GNQ5_9EURO|nr:uncharacterized protein Z517_06825 [Fonsecaea pedrosoi CBS 271.37]KIW80210.1 hypothetical protein Z517_06825 [Fonsecaea pedrosoi CBS 271.37]